MRVWNRPIVVATSALLCPCAVLAEHEHDHAEHTHEEGVHLIEEIHVIGVLRNRTANELAQSVDVLQGQTLERIATTNLGETLSGQLGVSSTYFSAGSSRPIIRGLAGTRVKAMEDGIDSMDASTVSADHAVSIDPQVAEQIEIFRGPTTLIYGSGAVGGVINTITNRIPKYSPDGGFEGVVELRGDTVANARSGVIALDVGGESFAWHFDAVSRQGDNYEIPGFASLSAGEEAHHEDHADDDEHEQAGELPGLVENSDFAGQSFSLGGSWLRDNGFLGVSISGFDSEYGIPGHHHIGDDSHKVGHDEEHDDAHGGDHDEEIEGEHEEEHEGEEEAVRVDLKQTRIDLKGGWIGLSGAVEAINLRFGATDYEHVEIEGESIGTRIENDAWEGRLELLHAPWGGWDGAFGFQVGDRRYSAVGAEAFIPPVNTSSYGVFIIEQRDVERWQISLGGRLDYQQQEPSMGLPAVSGTATSFSLAGIRHLDDGYSLVINSAWAERLPVADELYADGPHVATRAIEIGNPNLGAETSRHVDLGLRRTRGELSWRVTAFITHFDDFIYLRDIGAHHQEQELPIFHYVQRNARFSGLEAEFFAPIFYNGESEIDLRVFADFVNGKLSDGEHLPRMPPLRFGSRIQYHDSRLVAGLEVTHYDDQDKTPAFEEPTTGYTMWGADLNWAIETTGGMTFEVFVVGSNLADEDARKHTSFVKDTVPLPGRNVSAGFRCHF